MLCGEFAKDLKLTGREVRRNMWGSYMPMQRK